MARTVSGYPNTSRGPDTKYLPSLEYLYNSPFVIYGAYYKYIKLDFIVIRCVRKIRQALATACCIRFI